MFPAQGTIVKANYNAVEYAKLFRSIFGEEHMSNPMWEIRAKDIVYILAWVSGKGHEVYWFDESDCISPNVVLHKKLHHIEDSEDAFYWLIGMLEWSGFNHEGEARIKEIRKLGSYNLSKEGKIEKNRTVYIQKSADL